VPNASPSPSAVTSLIVVELDAPGGDAGCVHEASQKTLVAAMTQKNIRIGLHPKNIFSEPTAFDSKARHYGALCDAIDLPLADYYQKLYRNFRP
jgi:hypothetical protein